MDLTSPAALGQAVRRARRAADLSQVELADLAGLSRLVVTRLETGQANVTLDSLLRVASVLGMTLEATWDPSAATTRPLPRKRPRRERATTPKAGLKQETKTAAKPTAAARSRSAARPKTGRVAVPVDLAAVLDRTAGT
ncbi:MAG: helix-turn-helix transcriptional regulator [Nocardioidaceae bacterium]|nr:helix-turn-helix transcriptional regulator [Nocardioidaceae bacterium]